MALVDANYKFSLVSVGANGSASNAQVFNHSELRTIFEEDNLGLPEADTLSGDDSFIPPFLIFDYEFQFRTWMLKPYSRRNLTDDERILDYK